MNSPQQSPSGARKSVLFNQRDHSYSRSSPTLSSSSRSFKKRSTLSRFSSFFKPERESKSRSPTFSILVPLPSVIIERVTQLKSINSVDKKKLTQQTKTFDETSTENDGNGICLEIISSLEKEDIFLFDDIENITSIMNHSKQQQITFARVLCNEMEQSHFLLLQTITTYLCMHNNSSIQESFIQRLAYVTSEVLIPQLNEFFTVIKSNIDQIFELESIEPYYFIESNSRSIIAASANTMFELIFDDNYHEPQYMRNFIYFLPFIMKHRETYDKIMQYYNTFCNEHPSDTNSQAIISWKFTRLERLIQSWLEIMSSVIVEVEPIFFQEMLKTPLLTSDQLSILFKKKFKKILGDIGETTICIPEDVTPYTNNSAREILMTLSESSSNNETQLKILLETFSIDPIYSHTEKKSTIDLLQLKRDFFAEQLILFEFQSFQNVHCHDFYISRKTTTLNTYIAACQKIEYWAMSVMDILKKPDTYGFFIKVAKYCFEKKGYNTCYLLYSTLTQQSMKYPNIWSKIKKSKLQTYSRLQNLFDISNNFKNFRCSCDSENGLPLFSVWMHDIVNINTIPSKIENSQLFNFCKMRAIGSAVTKLISAQRTVFPFKPHQTVIKVLNDIFVPPN